MGVDAEQDLIQADVKAASDSNPERGEWYHSIEVKCENDQSKEQGQRTGTDYMPSLWCISTSLRYLIGVNEIGSYGGKFWRGDARQRGRG